jgi:hypothetical protein
VSRDFAQAEMGIVLKKVTITSLKDPKKITIISLLVTGQPEKITIISLLVTCPHKKVLINSLLVTVPQK